MAVTKIIGFQQYADYLNTQFIDFDGFGNLPFVQNKRRYHSLFAFRSLEDRVWLSAEGRNIGGSTYEEAARHPSCKIAFPSVYPGYLDGTYSTFNIGVRVKIPNIGASRPEQVLWLYSVDADPEGFDFSLFSRSEAPNVEGVEFYLEVKIDVVDRSVRRWLDGVELEGYTLPEHFTFENITTWHYHFNTKNQDDFSYQNFYINDLYFLVDTSQDVDGTPSDRLGSVYVKALVPEEVVVPVSWTVPPDTLPVDLVTASIRDPAMRDVPALTTDSTGESARVKFARPDVGEGEVIYTELEVYGYRNFGDNVQLHTRSHLGTASGVEKTYELEPERLKVGARAIRPGSLHNDLNGETWTEDKLANLELEVWTTKIE